MYYCKKLNESGVVESLVTYDRKPLLKNELSVEITEEEYNALHKAMMAAEEENLSEEETDELATEADYIAALQEVGVEHEE